MNRISTFVNNAYLATKIRAEKALAERERGDHLIEVLGTALVALVLIALFRDSLKEILTSIMNKVKTNAEALFDYSAS